LIFRQGGHLSGRMTFREQSRRTQAPRTISENDDDDATCRHELFTDIRGIGRSDMDIGTEEYGQVVL
jgi:hypothetical protein